MNDYTQVEVFESDTIEDVAKRLVANAPSSTIYNGIEIRVEVGQDPSSIVDQFQKIAGARWPQFAFSSIIIIHIESPGPGGKIDPRQVIKCPEIGKLYILWERRPDNSIGTVAVVMPTRETVKGIPNLSAMGIKLEVMTAPVVTALGSVLVEHDFRCAASERRLEAMEVRVTELEARLNAVSS
jgi:hypothetical protein